MKPTKLHQQHLPSHININWKKNNISKTVVLLLMWLQPGVAVQPDLFQQVDELISGQPLQQREVRELRGISPATLRHAGPPGTGLHLLILCRHTNQTRVFLQKHNGEESKPALWLTC